MFFHFDMGRYGSQKDKKTEGKKIPQVALVHWIPSLKLTANAPENGWLEDEPFLFEWPQGFRELGSWVCCKELQEWLIG